ncbi:hypothetical protein EDB85DRAFT_2087549 [Lactarius pseudohatsudake]|nr:hypothetical protein EDB85DRAFT_2087549 [Lactarius pseudohatsudake]
MSNAELEIDDDHPLALELSSLRTAVARFQHEAYASALKLQRHSLESAMAIERAQVLEHENAAARAELAALRAHPDTTPRPAELQLPELTLALRRASDKLTLAEDALRTRNSQFADVQGAAARAHHAAENAFALAAGARAREEDAMARGRALVLKLRVVEEEGKMMDRAVREYADLVRGLERRQGLPSSPPPSGTGALNRTSAEHGDAGLIIALQEEKVGLRKLAGEFVSENEALRDEIGKLQVELEGMRAELEGEQKAAEEERAQLSHALTELQLHEHDDNAAAKMVSRYMKFSQATTDTLQKSLESLKARHAATTATLHMQAASAQTTLASEQRQSTRLRNVLDEATEELAREAYGRRREIALRLAVVGREDQLVEALRRWVRRTQETRAKEDVPVEQRLDSIVGDAGDLLALVDGAAPREADIQGTGTSTGSVARIAAAQDTVRALVEELQLETERRMHLERVLGDAEVDEEGRIIPPPVHEPPTPPPKAEYVNTATEVTPEVVMVDAATSPICSPHQGHPSRLQRHHQKTPSRWLYRPISPLFYHRYNPRLLKREPTAIITLHQPAPRSAMGSPAFLSPRTSPSPSISTQENTFATTSPGSLALQDSTLASTNGFDTTKSPSSPASSISQLSSKRHSPPLLSELGNTKTRYDELQRAFRDCHLALRELDQTLQALPTTSSLPTSALQVIFTRLDDFNEDARVELEIRIADEERIARGYATLLAVPGAITSEAEAQDVERAVRAFVDGSDAAVARALNQFSRKRDDLEHDIAALKLAVHEVPQAQLQPDPQFQSQAQSRPTTPAPGSTANASWTSLAAGLFTAGSSRPASPSPTFGSMVTSLRGRRVVSSSSDGSPGGSGPLATLQRQFRIPMPDLHQHHAPPPPSPGLPGPRARTTSGMYMLGLGMRGGVIPGRKPTGLGRSVQRAEVTDSDEVE